MGLDGAARTREPGAEVSCLALTPFFRQLATQDLPDSALTEGLGIPAAHLREPSRRIAWTDFVRLCENASAIWSEKELERLGGVFIDAVVKSRLTVLLRPFFTAADLYHWSTRIGAGLGDRMFRCAHGYVNRLSPERARGGSKPLSSATTYRARSGESRFT